MILSLALVSILGLSWTTVVAFPCEQMLTAASNPKTANSVRPSDVAVLSIIGQDSLSPELSSVLSKLQELMSWFSPSLIGPFSDPTSLVSPLQFTDSSLSEQAQEVSLQLQHTQDSWKLVLFIVRVDELCACEEQQVLSAVHETVKEVDEALQILQSQLSKTIVSVALWDGEKNSQQNRKCFCSATANEEEAKLWRALQTFTLQRSLRDMLKKKSWFNKDREDFTVVLQDSPLLRESASAPSGGPLTDSHSSDKLLIQMWTNLLQPTAKSHHKHDIIAAGLPCPSELQPFLRTHTNSYLKESEDLEVLPEPLAGTEMPCVDLSPSPTVPESVHELRPGDVKVVAALGDSLTAGNGVGSKNPNNLLDVLTQYRGLSWSIGGDENLTSVTTLPNILRNFNPGLTGFSLGTGRESSPQASLNQAVAGAKSDNMITQVQALVKRMKNDSKVNFAEDWKVITVFIGGNDMCDFCKNSLLYSPENYITNVRIALDYLHKEVPRALVNLVEPLHITPLREMHLGTTKCPTWLVNVLCPCVIQPKNGSDTVAKLETLLRDYQTALNTLVESGRYDTHDNFTVVVQPFFREIVFPRQPDGRPDKSFFSPDCFHLSQKAHTLMARSLWNNMLEPLGNKTCKQDFMADINIKCPTKTSPFIRTYNNSNFLYPAPPPTPGPITNWGSDFSCVDLAPSDSVPTSVHRLRPADIKVVAALGDSVTAGVAAKANNIFGLSRTFRGVAWSIGGDKSLDTVTTLPNILKKFNPEIVGSSKGYWNVTKGFNMATTGAMSIDIKGQVEALISALINHKAVDFENDWKLVTVFVGKKDLCNYCLNQNNLTAKQYSHNVMEGLDMLYQSVPRVLVNVVQVLQIDPLKSVQKNTLSCGLLQRTECPCVINPSTNSPELEEIKRINREYQAELEFLISGDRYDGKSDFAVVLQPFLQNYFIPYIGEGEVDTSFYSLDCFHLSERAQAEMAIALWNNMLEPVGRKTAFNNYTYSRSKIHCPTQTNPFIFTKTNSVPSLPTTVPPTTPSTPSTPTPGLDITTTTSLSPTPSSEPTPQPLCPRVLPVWVPVVAAVGSLLVGFVVAWAVCSCVKKSKSFSGKGTTF